MIILENDQAQIEDGNVVFLNGPINTDSADYVIRNIIEKNQKEAKDKPDHIKLLINSPGGEVTDCMAIVDMMSGSPIPVWTYGLGIVGSCGLIIFISGTPGKRFMFKNTSILSHQWWGAELGKEHELKAVQKENKNVTNRIYKIYQETTGLPKEEIAKNLLPPQDVWLTPKEALKFKLCDKIIATLE